MRSDEKNMRSVETTVSGDISGINPTQRTPTREGVLTSFRYRDFTILWSGAFLSNLGTWIHTTALLWFVKELTDSNAWVGAVNMASFLPVLLFVLWAGSLADRLDRKKLILATQVVMMLGALALGICVSAGWTSMALIMVITAIMGMAFVFNFPAWRSIIPDLVPPEHMLNGIALDAAQFNLARSVGPLLGSFIVGVWSVQAAFYVNAVSFLAVIIALLAVRTPTPGSLRTESISRHILEGMGYGLRQRWSRNLLLILGIISFFGLSFMVLLPGVSKDVLERGSFGYGALLGAVGVGAVAGAPLVTLLRRVMAERAIIKYATLGFGLSLLAVSFCRNFWLCLVLTAGMGVFGLMMSATVNTVLQARVEREMRGRIMSLYILVFQGIFPLGGLFLGLVSDLRSIPFAMSLGGIVCTATGIFLIAVPSFLKGAVSVAR
jgi:MFS family permease